jgi:hypothetical protein
MVAVTLKNGGKMSITFMGGSRYPQVIAPFYITDNKDIQDALEASPSFNSSYFLDSESEIKEPEKQSVNTVADKSVKNQKTEQVPDNVEEPKDLTLKEFANINLAKEYLVNEHGVERRAIPSLKSVINKGVSLGLQIVIPEG